MRCLCGVRIYSHALPALGERNCSFFDLGEICELFKRPESGRELGLEAVGAERPGRATWGCWRSAGCCVRDTSLGWPSELVGSPILRVPNVLRVVKVLIVWRFCFFPVNEKEVFQHLCVTAHYDLERKFTSVKHQRVLL